MAKRNEQIKNQQKSVCSAWCPGWSKEEWFSGILSTVSAYLLIWYFLRLVSPSGRLWLHALILLLLLHTAVFTCPFIRKHYFE